MNDSRYRNINTGTSIKSRLLTTAAICGMVLAAPVAAHAQAAFQGKGAPPTTGAQPPGGFPSQAKPTALPPTGAAAPAPASSEVNLTPSPIQQIGQTMYDHGIYFTGRYLGEFADNPTGGARQGADYAGELSFGATVDMEKLAGLKGGSFHVLFTQRHGNNLAAQTINNSVSVQQIYGGGQTAQLTIFTYEQKLFDDMVDVEFGRTDLGDEFQVSPFYCDFQSNAFCGNPDAMGKITSTPFYPVSIWGGRVLIAPSPNVYMKIGAYQSDPNTDPGAHHGFDWGTEGSNGFLIPIEAGFKFNQAGAVADNQYDVGVIFDRTHYSAPFFNAFGPEQFGRTAVYAQAQQMVYQPVADKPQGIYLFAQAMAGVSGGKQVANFEAEAGMIWQGIVASRPDDNLGFAISDVHYNNRYLNYLYDGVGNVNSRVAQGGTELPDNNMMMMELHYAVQINPWLNVMPNFQYIIHPDGQAFTKYPVANLNNAAVFGVQLFIDLPTLFGIPTKS